MKENKKRSMITNFLYLIRIYLSYAKGWFIIVAVSCVIPAIHSYIDVILIRDTVNSISDNLSINNILSSVGLFLLIYSITFLVEQFIEVYMGEKVNVKTANRINKDIYLKVLKVDYKYFDDPEFYDNYTWTLNSFYQQTFSAIQVIWRLIFILFTLGTLITIIGTMDFLVVIIIFITVIISTFFNAKLNKENFKKNNSTIKYYRKLNYIQRIFYLKEFSIGIKSTNSKNIFMSNYDENSKSILDIIDTHRGRITIYGSISTLIFIFTKMSILIYLCYRALNGYINIGEVAALFYATDTLKVNFENLFGLITKIQNLNLYTDKIRKFFEMESTIEINANKNKIIDNSPISITFKNVSFRYNSNSKEVLRNMNFEIKKGQKVAIVGENGAGKSTITKLLLRLYDVSKGQILINDNDIREIDVKSLRDNIGIAFQDSILYAVSIKENITVYNEHITDDEIYNILQKLNLSKVLLKNQANLDTQITKEFDEDGIQLSGGEQQLMAMARILTKEFGMLILDEPSSSLDPLIEYDINKLIMDKENRATTIIISHRLSTVRDADCILMLGDGYIVESGTHSELMNLKGKYYEMFSKQAENYIKE